MAEDDPYNFEIEIPGNKKAVKSRNESDNDDSKDDDDNSDAMSSPSPHKSLKGGKKPAKQPAIASKSNALDKAKNFLSKYSTKQATPAAKSRARVQLSDDSDSDQDPKRKSVTKKPVEDSMDDLSDVASRRAPNDESVGDISGLSEFDESADNIRAKAKPMVADSIKPAAVANPVTATPSGATSHQHSNDSDDSEPKPPVVMQTVAKAMPIVSSDNHVAPVLHKTAPLGVTVQDEDYSDIEDEVESIGEVTTPKPKQSLATIPTRSATFSPFSPPVSTPATTPQPAQSFNYSMDFSDDDNDTKVAASPVVVATPSPLVQTRASHSDNDEYLDESFAQSQSPHKTTLPPPSSMASPSPLTTAVLYNPPAATEDEYLDESFADDHPRAEMPTLNDQSAEPTDHDASSEFGDDEDDASIAPVEATTAPTLSSAEATKMVSPNADESTAFKSAPKHMASKSHVLDGSVANNNHTRQAEREQQREACDSRDPTPGPPPENDHYRTTSQPSVRRRVEIVREYEHGPRAKVEMKDASTQFTGNHVLIQADLNPHHQGGACNDTTAHFQFPPPFSCHTSPKAQPPVEPIPTTDSTQPPPDPNAPVDSHGMMGTFMDATMASVNTTLSTSMYRQQLQHIQTQIRRKRLESERVMREAMAYRYTSMDAAEKVYY
ncbi:hypothetical protein DYB31_007483 [Aphanomyces astaci]|uniref:Uncharacterized protein n=1 Tax=Aphanomyces astaci TaxID=112090 RepID=A0A397F547_APHAT|nr:hypothetical protein DYB31_007483 [Aphanomyces astaci]